MVWYRIAELLATAPKTFMLTKEQEMRRALQVCVPCLEDGIRLMGFGETCREYRTALAMVQQALKPALPLNGGHDYTSDPAQIN